MKIVLASHNPGKIKELTHVLKNIAIEVIPEDCFGFSEVAETGLSFIENALLKARHAAKMTHLPALADDSGLIVDALNGAPGIYSARYAGEKATARDNITLLLNNMSPFKAEARRAYFYCVMVFMQSEHDPTPIICEGKWQGFILNNPQGKAGFGYDPIFFDPHIHATAAELSVEQKNKISHRGLALQLLVEKLRCMQFP